MNKKIFFTYIFFVLVSSLFAQNIVSEADSISGDKSKNTLTFEGNAHIHYEETDIHADFIKFDKINGRIEASGNVKATLKYSKITGSKLIYLIDSKGAIVENGTLNIENFRFKAKVIESENQNYFHLKDAYFTSCPEDCDKWFFKAKDIKLKREGYVTFKSLKFEVNGKTYLYLPAFIYPAKTKRAAGLLIPSFGSSSKYGFKYNQELFIPMGNSHDLTIEADYYAKSGTGLGLEYRLSRKVGEFGRFYGYSINDRIKTKEDETSTRRSFSDISYSYSTDNWNFFLDSFEGNDFDLIRDFNFDKYSFAMREFFTNFNGQFKTSYFNFNIGVNRKNIIFQENEEKFSTLPSIGFSSKNIVFKNRSFNLNGNIQLIDTPLFDESLTRSKLNINSITNHKLASLNVVEKESLTYTNYSSNNLLKSNLKGEFSLKFMTPFFIKERENFSHKFNLFAKSGYRKVNEQFPDNIYDINDYLKPEGVFVQAGMESVLSINNKIVTGGFYIEKTFNNEFYHNQVLTEKTSKYTPITTYFNIPFKMFDLSFEAKYDTSLNELDKILLTTNIANKLRISYLKAYTYGEEEKRDSIITSFNHQINEKWNTSLTLDYDFKISEFRYQVYSITYYNKCIGFSLKYLNNTYTIRDDNEITFSLILKDIGDFLKYKMGL